MFIAVTAAVHASLLLLLLRQPLLSAMILAGYGAYHVVLAWAILHPRSRLFGPNRARLDTREHVVALTFDDGPHPTITPKVLDILRARGARATFFLVGKWVTRHPEIARRIVAEGHAVGNHSQEHSYAFWALSPRRLSREVAAAQDAIAAAAGAECRVFRAPVGLKSPFLHPILRRRGLELVSWDVRGIDRGPCEPAKIRKRLWQRVAPGSILLLHDGHDRKPEGNPAIIERLPVILDALHEQGYRITPL